MKYEVVFIIFGNPWSFHGKAVCYIIKGIESSNRRPWFNPSFNISSILDFDFGTMMYNHCASTSSPVK